jgi:hypothetical protein
MDKSPEEKRITEESIKQFGFDVSENFPNQKFFQPSDTTGTIYESKFQPCGDSIYGEHPELKQITIPSHDGTDHIDQVLLRDLPLHIHQNLAWAAESSGKAEFQARLENYTQVLKEQVGIGEELEKCLNGLVQNCKDCLTDKEFESIVTATRAIFREMKVKEG